MDLSVFFNFRTALATTGSVLAKKIEEWKKRENINLLKQIHCIWKHCFACMQLSPNNELVDGMTDAGFAFFTNSSGLAFSGLLCFRFWIWFWFCVETVPDCDKSGIIFGGAISSSETTEYSFVVDGDVLFVGHCGVVVNCAKVNSWTNRWNVLLKLHIGKEFLWLFQSS